MEVALKIASLALLALSVQSAVLPVEKCTLTDKACMVPAVQKMLPYFVAGMPEYDVDVLDPLAMEDIKFDLSGLQFSLSGGTLKGLKNAEIDGVDWNDKKKTFTFLFHTDGVVKGAYTAAGRILILPITGDGKMKLTLKNIEIKLKIHYDTEKIGDKEHLKLTKYSAEFDVKGNAHFALTNLFNGNKELSDAMLTFLNENWKQVSQEFGKPLVNSAANLLYNNMAKFFTKLPIEDIANV